ncbi:MAG: Gfo/Idh/MocA family oxidoreductase [Caldilineaceae bacterium]
MQKRSRWRSSAQAGGAGSTRVWAERPDIELCAIAGRTLEKTQVRAAEYGVRAYVDVDEMLDKERPDLVSLSLPNQGHFDATLQVIRAGYPLLVEKPLVFDLHEADILLKEAKSRGCSLRSTSTIGMRGHCRWPGRRWRKGGWATWYLRYGGLAETAAATTRTPT